MGLGMPVAHSQCNTDPCFESSKQILIYRNKPLKRPMSNEVMNSLSRLSLRLGAWIPTQDEAININE